MANKIECICTVCGKIFYKYPSQIKNGAGKYCGKECYQKFHTSGTSIIKCKQCGKEFKLKQSMIIESGNFCSYKCAGKWRSENIVNNKNPNWKGGLVKKICLTCGKEFGVYPAIDKKGGGKYCSYECLKTSKIIECEVCGKEFSAVPSRKNARYCSIKCKDIAHTEWMKENALRGKDNPNWTGGWEINKKKYELNG